MGREQAEQRQADEFFKVIGRVEEKQVWNSGTYFISWDKASHNVSGEWFFFSRCCIASMKRYFSSFMKYSRYHNLSVGLLYTTFEEVLWAFIGIYIHDLCNQRFHMERMQLMEGINDFCAPVQNRTMKKKSLINLIFLVMNTFFSVGSSNCWSCGDSMESLPNIMQCKVPEQPDYRTEPVLHSVSSKPEEATW